jgi:hypothetical protein
MIFGVVDLFLPAPGRGVVGIESKDLVVPLERKIVTARVVIAIGFGEQRFYFLDFGDELRTDRLVEVTGLVQMGEKVPCRTTIRVVTIAQNLAQDCFRADIISLRDAGFGQNDSAFAKSFHSFVVRFSRDYGVRQIPESGPKFLVRERIIFCLHRSFALLQRRFALRDGALTPVNFPLGDGLWILRKARRAQEG